MSDSYTSNAASQQFPFLLNCTLSPEQPLYSMCGASPFELNPAIPSLPGRDPARVLALAAGELHDDILRRGIAKHRQSGPDPQKRLTAWVRDLGAARLLRRDEEARLIEVINHVIEVDRRRGRSESSIQAIHRIAHELRDLYRNPLAGALAHIAYDSARQAATYFGTNPSEAVKSGPTTADFEGALLGADAGVRLGSSMSGISNIAGGVVGSIYGGAFGSLTWAIDHVDWSALPEQDCGRLATLQERKLGSELEQVTMTLREPQMDPMHISAAAGELHGKLLRGYVQRFRCAGLNPHQFTLALIDELKHSIPMAQTEGDSLARLAELMNSLQGCAGDQECMQRTGQEIRKVHESLVDSETSPTIIAISAIADHSAHKAVTGGHGLPARQSPAVAMKDFTGAVGGALAGGVAGSIIGAGSASYAAWVDAQTQTPGSY